MRQASSENGDPAAGIESLLEGLDETWTRAETQVSDWQTITLRWPVSDESATFQIDAGNGARPDLSSELRLNRKTGEVLARTTYSDQETGRQLRSWARWIHTGEAFGWIGQSVAGIASLAGVFLVWTGFSLSWRRWRSWARRRERALPGLTAASPADQ